MARLLASTISRWLWPVALAVRLVVIALLVVGPWTDEPSELEGWDAQRFQEIADRRGDAWVDEPIEYPPGSVMIFDRLAGDDVVSTNRRLILVSGLAELVGVAILWRTAGARVAKAFLILGLPLVPMGLMRLDMLVTILALLAALALIQPKPPGGEPPGGDRSWWTAAFGVLVGIGAMVKIWPALLVAAAIALRNRSAAVAAIAVTAGLGFTWLGVVGNGLEPLDQVLSLRGATGWHVESLPGAIHALLTGAEPRRELNAFRIGTLNQPLVTVGRIVALAIMAGLTVSALRSGTGDRIHRVALVMLGSTAALIVTAPLLSPQFLLWLTPWGALLLAPGAGSFGDGATQTRNWFGPFTMGIGLLAGCLTLTGGVLTVFGPENLAATGPALLLTIRNGMLAAIALWCLARLNKSGR